MGFNLKDVQTKGGGFTPLPVGVYNLRIEKVDIKKSKSNNDMINLQLVVTDGQYAGRYVFDQLAFTESSLWKIKTMLEVVGSKLVDSDNVEVKEIATELLYKPVAAYVEIVSDGKGGQTNQPKQYRAVTTVTPTIPPKAGGLTPF